MSASRPAPPATLPAAIIARFTLPSAEAIVRALCEAETRALEWHGGDDLRSFYEAQWERHRGGAAAVLVVEWNRFPMAKAAVYWHGKPTHPHIPDIQSLRVFPAFRGLGVGTQLLATCEEIVAAAGYPQVSLAVRTRNPRARALYERVGYRAVGEPYDDEWGYDDARGTHCRVVESVVDLVKALS